MWRPGRIRVQIEKRQPHCMEIGEIIWVIPLPVRYLSPKILYPIAAAVIPDVGANAHVCQKMCNKSQGIG